MKLNERTIREVKGARARVKAGEFFTEEEARVILKIDRGKNMKKSS
jgi:hypothetical protein